MRLRRLRSEDAWRTSWFALWSSRLLVWLAGIAAGVALPSRVPPEIYAAPKGLVRSLGSVGEVLAGPAARWDAGFYLLIAKEGYRFDLGAATASRAAFYPLYPLLVRLVGFALPLTVAGVFVSLCAFGVGLYGIYKLTAFELSRGMLRSTAGPQRIARLAVLLIAFSPMAFFFSAVYSESLFLALSVWLFWCARHGRWAWVGVLGALATLTRAPGLLLALPALVIYLYGPRSDGPPKATIAGKEVFGFVARARTALRPRYRLRWDVMWLGLMPLGVLLFCSWAAIDGGHFTAPLTVEGRYWNRHLADPLLTMWRAVELTARQIAQANPHAWIGASVVLAIVAAIGVFRRLPIAYGLYAAGAILFPLSQAVPGEPLLSIPRFVLVAFPLWIWLAAWLAEHPRLIYPVLAVFAIAMMGFTASFSTWAFVA